MSLGIKLTNNEIKDIMKVIKSLEIGGILFKGTSEKVISQKRGFLGNVLGPLMKVGLRLMKNVLTPSAKNVLLLLGLTAAASETNAPIQKKKIYGLGMTILIISNKEIKNNMKTVKSLEESGLLIKVVSETIENEIKKQKGQFFGMLFGTLDASLLGNMLAGTGVIKTCEGTSRPGQDSSLN